MANVIHDPVLGELKADETTYVIEVQWMGEPIELRFEVPNDPAKREERIKKVSRMVQEQEKWNAMLEEEAVHGLLDQANDWYADQLEDEDPDVDMDEVPDITEEEFCQRIKLESISIDEEGEFEAWYSDGDLFLGHSIRVEGSLVDEETYVAFMY